jgi:hypothetical protein
MVFQYLARRHGSEIRERLIAPSHEEKKYGRPCAAAYFWLFILSLESSMVVALPRVSDATDP